MAWKLYLLSLVSDPRLNTALLARLASTKFHVKLHIRLSTLMVQEDSLKGAANSQKYITVSFQAVTPVRLSCVTALHKGAELRGRSIKLLLPAALS
jgi:hypothetical protein